MPPPLLAAPAPAPALTQRASRILAAINKIKEELMLMGFISLMLLACEDQITYFCVPDAVARWITCDSSAEDASCSATDTTWVSGAPCCTLGDYYWDHLYASTIPLGDHRRLENETEPEPEAAQDMMAEAWSHRRLGSVNRQNSLLRNTCPSQKFTTDYDAYGVAIMPPAAHAFDCPVNGFRSYLPFTETLGIPTPPSPLFLGRFSPVFRRFSAVPLRCPASWRRDGENARKMAETGRNLGEKRARNSGG